MPTWEDAGVSEFGNVRKTTSNGPEAIALVDNELSKIMYRKPSKNRVSIPCPFHISDSGFSRTLNVNLNPNRTNGKGFHVPVGYFHCWSCGASGPWNKLANHLNLQPLEETDNPDISSGLTQIAWDEEYTKPDDSLLAEVDEDWQHKDCTIYKETLSDFGVMQYQKVSLQNGDYVMFNKLWLPARMNQELVGHVEIRLEDDDPEPKYLNSPGPWSHRNWVGFDYVRKYFGRSHCALVEGPADFLRLVQNNIPTLPLLGVQSWSLTKRAALNLAFDDVFVIGDGDEAGSKMRKTLLEAMPDAYGITLPDGIDPAKLSRAELRDVKKIIKRHLGGN